MGDFKNWSVVSFGDLSITGEAEMPVAVKGAVKWTNTNVMHKVSTQEQPYTLVAGRLDFAGSQGQLKLLSGKAKVAIDDPSNLDVLTKDSNGAQVMPHIVAKGSSYDTQPNVEAQWHQSDGSEFELGKGVFDSLFSQDRAQKNADRVAKIAGSSCVANIARVVQPKYEGDGTRVVLDLGTETNYWTISAAELSKLKEINTGNTAAKVLVINVTGTDALTLGLNLTGNTKLGHVLINAPQVASIDVKDTIDASILAPRAKFVKTGGNTQGHVVVGSAELGGSEEHLNVEHEFTWPLTDCTEETPAPVVGSFSVVKKVEGAVAGEKKFEFSYECSDGSRGSVSAKGDGVAVPVGKDFAVGTECTVTEDVSKAKLDGYTLVREPKPVKVVVEKAPKVVSASFTNIYEKPAPVVGSFSVVKKVEGAVAGEKKFEFSYECSDGSRGSVSAKGDGVAVPVGKDFAVGTECTVTEDVSKAKLDGYTLVREPKPVKVVVEKAPKVVSASFTNTYEKPGQPKLAKTGASTPIIATVAGLTLLAGAIATVIAKRRRMTR
ncbi:DUF5979 domain-containing protein [Actinomyces sp. B33]|uniref:DUF5979 domain-containing protein n=1 Tax=Actinomyces sp. B33 TaxID=2942131 RepID=UPI00233FA971|nr:DUF5979 domain-containing protein [Actinomyces sp. B33]MDC4232252.1 DUF5979 domain-containing protein [Actinomyces sp. B33]